jgi:hypothetical protein
MAKWKLVIAALIVLNAIWFLLVESDCEPQMAWVLGGC